MKEEVLKAAGVDYKGALDRFVGNRQLYEKYLDKFLADQHLSDAKKAFEQEDYHEVLAQVHALKGLAGTLGMQGLFAASSDMVNALRKDQTKDLASMMDRVEKEQDKMIKAIRT